MLGFTSSITPDLGTKQRQRRSGDRPKDPCVRTIILPGSGRNHPLVRVMRSGSATRRLTNNERQTEVHVHDGSGRKRPHRPRYRKLEHGALMNNSRAAGTIALIIL